MAALTFLSGIRKHYILSTPLSFLSDFPSSVLTLSQFSLRGVMSEFEVCLDGALESPVKENPHHSINKVYLNNLK